MPEFLDEAMTVEKFGAVVDELRSEADTLVDTSITWTHSGNLLLKISKPNNVDEGNVDIEVVDRDGTFQVHETSTPADGTSTFEFDNFEDALIEAYEFYS